MPILDLRPKFNNDFDWKKTLQAILIGAAVAFATSLCDGILHVLEGYGNDFTGGVTTTLLLIRKFV